MERDIKGTYIVNIVTQMEAGGAQKAAFMVTNALLQRGIYSELWFLYKKREVEDYIRFPNVRIFSDRQPRGIGEIYAILRKVEDAFASERPTGVITFTHYANVLGQLAAWKAGVRYRLATQRSPSWLYPLVARVLDMLWGSLGIYSANVYVSHSVELSFRSYPVFYRKRSHTILNGLEQPQPTLSRNEARKRFGLPLEATVILSVGRLAYQKNHELLIKLFAEKDLNKCDKNTLLVIAGEGELRPRLEGLIAELGLGSRVYLLGEVTPKALPNLLVASDIFAFPSRFEAFGFALVEAMMMGLPVIASDIPSNREIVSDSGILLPIDDLRSWVGAVCDLLKDEQRRRILAERAKARSANFDLQRMVDGYLRVLFKGG